MAFQIKTISKRSSFFAPCRPALLPALLCCVLALPACKPAPVDYNLYESMGAYMQGKLEAAGAKERTDMPAIFADPDQGYTVRLRGLVRLVFGSRKLQVYLRSYEGDAIAVGSISQFEVPPGSDNYTDCAFVVRPTAKMRAPVMHGDARAAMAGTDDEFSMDFYTYDNATIDIEDFFSDNQTALLEQAMALVEQYQVTGEERGEYTVYLNPYKSKYRLELAAPETEDEAARKAYFDAALQAFKLYQDAYFAALDNATRDDDGEVVQSRASAAAAFIDLFEEYDVAVKLGRLLFGKEDFPLYFNQGFWREGFYGDNATAEIL